ncbi:similar to Saccharomyces cerevisiae YIL120W QDR1 Multidrug transporter of the major facilitator superfamily, required for resistance to quinidine, ketoconazole, fluconazole, and barban [Maudiozyma saulgeensis]|uniref:Similar to Saccharomyces cerevisiae YIL120W QDR1 Multidrug transporter of the major facilitator superfamily, required for resistance to quinidine, ketoconazole, fluconazole, and barban n=1 Tax=Maudiozyma saulgeensis TaxID=1789683 RepID=A0A1X7QZG8_9SACH|nr:similar to Saccharomyces cerevisiae YIL120W QDR1 Multidrug transporter of the major facilitator superfamily, required for resistance to quinidine, ketoconazole, fluconazole, and barban [Kazachstania saulgeensis]
MADIYSLHTEDETGSSIDEFDTKKYMDKDEDKDVISLDPKGLEKIYSKQNGTLSRMTTREVQDNDSSDSLDIDSFKENNSNQSINTPPYTLLNYSQKWCMVAILTMCGFWSSLASPIYYPALKQLEKEFNLNEDKVNVTVVVYLLFQGIAPTFSGGLADVYGRRPIILGGMLIYVVASIGLANAPSYGVICFLRIIQSIGISPTIAISSGVVGDYTLKHERGTFVGATSGFVLIGQGIGPLLGAVIAARWDWRAIFYFLAIGCGASFIFGFLCLPETKRTLVGNLSIKPKRIWSIAPITLLSSVQKRLKYDNPDLETLDKNVPSLDLIGALKITAQPEIILALFPAGLQFAMWTLMLSSISSGLSSAPYNYSLPIIGVCYLPAGIGGLCGSFLTGRVIDYYYKKAVKKFEQDKAEGRISQDAKFNTFKVRLLCVLPQNFLAVISFLLFGWSIDKGWKIPAALITSFVSSYCAMSTLSTMTTLLVDLYPGKSSTASSCFNFVRCSLSSIFMGCFADMKQSMTVGGTFSFLIALLFLANGLTFIPIMYGTQWREKRMLKEELKAQLKAEKEIENEKL